MDNFASAARRLGFSRDETHAFPALRTYFLQVRKQSELLCEPLTIDDYGIQTMPDVSPPKWHLAHVTWFYETFLLKPFLPSYQPYHPKFHYLFNSYYETAGTFHPRPERGNLSRPTVEEVYRYRSYVDEHMLDLLNRTQLNHYEEIATRTILGCNHEQQHQELLLTDIKHILARNPLRPTYRVDLDTPTGHAVAVEWGAHPAGVVEAGYDGDGFCFDNERPRHKVYLTPFRLASRLTTNGEYLEFMEAGGYENVELWLSEGWKTVAQQGWRAPLYWEKIDGQWWYMTLAGLQPVNEQAPVCHVSFYEADAYARWRGVSLATEEAWESVASKQPVTGNFVETMYFQPAPARSDTAVAQIYGDVWEWTRSAYTPYPGFRPLEGTLGEYNGKFMCSQIVLRGGSCVTPQNHIRASYRNFFYPADRWQFTGIRLAEEQA